MAETFANNAVGNLNANITNVATSLVLQAGQGAAFPATGNFRILVESELMLVGARSGDTLSSITRGIEGTANVAHNSPATVTHVLTAAALGSFTQVGGGLAGPPGTELVYNQITANVTVSGTSGAQTTVITGSSFAYDGATAVYIEVYSPGVITGAADNVVITLTEDATDIGQIGLVSTGGVASAIVAAPVFLRLKRTPSNASHTYIVKAYRTTNNGTFQAGTGGAAQIVPAFLRVVKA